MSIIYIYVNHHQARNLSWARVLPLVRVLPLDLSLEPELGALYSVIFSQLVIHSVNSLLYSSLVDVINDRIRIYNIIEIFYISVNEHKDKFRT